MNNNYTIEIEYGTRMEGGVLDGTPMHPVEYTQYNILRDGQLVGFVFDAEDINTAIEAMEKYPRAAETMHSRFD